MRIVYDGTARSGKTTTLRSLGVSLGREVETPAETEGRTLYFDWLDYTGGRFDGRAIRCQVVTVPGQTSLEHRRKKLLFDADAVVFVADTSAAGYPASLAALRESLIELAERQPPVGLVVQANQRDRLDAVPIAKVRTDCAALSLNLAVTESSATSGLGVRETFVFAVRLALDRVRELQQSAQLVAGRPEVDDATALFAELTTGEASESSLRTWAAGVEVSAEPRFKSGGAARSAAERPTPAHQSAPWPPAASVPSGLIWPPVAGRFMLHEAAEAELAPIRRTDGSWANEEGSSWRLHSDLEALYFDLDEGRSALIDWARHHAALAPLLSRRCIVLARAAPRAWRLWQLVLSHPSLDADVRRIWGAGTPESIASVLLEAAKRSLDVQPRLAATPLAELGSLGNLTVEGGLTVYGGLFPAKIGRAAAEDGAAESAGEILRHHLAPILRDFVTARAWEHNLKIVVEIRRRAEERGWAGIGEILCRLLPPA
ncbi:MAG: GTPase domain-containing protein [Acidobacteriota bacterium]